jgi:hypothetical protein
VRRHTPILVTAAATLALTLLLAAIGADPWFLGPAMVLRTLLTSGILAAAWCFAAWGIGVAAARMFLPDSRVGSDAAGARAVFALPIGVALMLFLSHALGVLGLLRTGWIGATAAWAPIVLGIALLLRDARREHRPPAPGSSWLILPAAPPLAALLLAACCPPGTLWASEARGFDILSYHLQLPKEWLAAGRLAPLDHNAYSWLPSSMEAAYLHLGAMATPVARDPFTGGEGIATFAASLLHAKLAVAAAIAVANLAATLSGRALAQGSTPSRSAILAGLFFLSVPWVIVTGSLAYNEMPVCLMLAASLSAIEKRSLFPACRGVLIGLFVAAAGAAKPTALFMVAAPLGVLLLWRTAPRHWLPLFAGAAAAGLLTLTPYFVRNWLAGGSPVFPYLTSIFGEAHWSNLEVARWRAGHHGPEPLKDRVVHLFTRRGFGHQHWSVIPATGALLLAILWRSRPAAGMLGMCAVVQIALWMLIGHAQSRFLLPAAVAFTPAFALVCGHPAGGDRPRTRRLFAAVAAITGLIPLLALARDTAWRPGLFASAGLPFLTAEALPPPPADPANRARERNSLAPHQWINLAHAGSIRRLYLLGDSTPYYFRVTILYHTTWDPSPLGVLLRETADDWDEIVSRLAAPPPEGLGVSHVLVNFDELHRLHRDGWYDPDASPDAAAELIRRSTIVESWSIAGSAGRVLIELER